VQVYLAVLDDVSPEQAQPVFEHVRSCGHCQAELRLLSQVAPLATAFDEFAPPAPVDQAVMAAISARGQMPHHVFAHRFLRERRSPWLMLFAAAAELVVMTMTTFPLLGALFSAPRAFTLPANLLWSGYVLYHTETMNGVSAVKYHIRCYHDLESGFMHVKNTEGNDLDIVAVGTGQELLGEDLVHYIADWGATTWGMDDSLFDLGQLRADLHSHHAMYLGQGTFRGQEVYRIRMSNGLVILLDMRHLPVNVLQNAGGSGTSKPLHETLMMLPATQVPAVL
jgi:hypothetical protein